MSEQRLRELVTPELIHRVFRRINYQLHDDHLAQEAASALFEQVIARHRQGRFDPEKGTFEDWVIGFVPHVVRQVLRIRARDRLLKQVLLGLEPRDVLDSDVPALWLRDAIATLAPRDQVLIVGHAVAGLSVNELAGRLDTSPSAVTTGLSRARLRLRRELGGQSPQ